MINILAVQALIIVQATTGILSTDIGIFMKFALSICLLVIGYFIRKSYIDFGESLKKQNKLYEEMLQLVHKIDNRVAVLETKISDCKNCP